MKLRGELRLIERAIRQGWKTPPDKQQRAVDLAIETLRDETANTRERLAAMRVIDALVQLDGSTDSEIKKRANDALRRYVPLTDH